MIVRSRGGLPEVTTFGECIACDFIIVSKARTEDRNNVVLVVRDEFSGLMRAFPCGSKSSETINKHLLAFLGPRFQVAPIEHDEKRSGWRVHCIMFTWASSVSLLLRAGGLTTANSRGRFALLKRCQEHFIYRLVFIPSKVYGSWLWAMLYGWSPAIMQSLDPKSLGTNLQQVKIGMLEISC